MENNTIGSFLSALRKANGMTQKELAERLNVSDKAVSRWERNESCPDITLIPVIADIFGVTSDELLRGERNSIGNPVKETERTEKEIAHFLESVRFCFLIQTVSALAVAAVGLAVRMIIVNKVTGYPPFFYTDEALDAWHRKMDIMDCISSVIGWAAFLLASAYVAVGFLKAQAKLSRINGEEGPVINAKKKVKRIFLVGGCILVLLFILNLIFSL